MHVYDNTETPKRIIRKHKDDLSICPNEYWSEQDIFKLTKPLGFSIFKGFLYACVFWNLSNFRFLSKNGIKPVC